VGFYGKVLRQTFLLRNCELLSGVLWKGIETELSISMTHSDNRQNFREERQGETTGEDFGWYGKLAGEEVDHENDK
jgi:hypothetical protein